MPYDGKQTEETRGLVPRSPSRRNSGNLGTILRPHRQKCRRVHELHDGRVEIISDLSRQLHGRYPVRDLIGHGERRRLAAVAGDRRVHGGARRVRAGIVLLHARRERERELHFGNDRGRSRHAAAAVRLLQVRVRENGVGETDDRIARPLYPSSPVSASVQSVGILPTVHHPLLESIQAIKRRHIGYSVHISKRPDGVDSVQTDAVYGVQALQAVDARDSVDRVQAREPVYPVHLVHARLVRGVHGTDAVGRDACGVDGEVASGRVDGRHAVDRAQAVDGVDARETVDVRDAVQTAVHALEVAHRAQRVDAVAVDRNACWEILDPRRRDFLKGLV